MKKAKKIIVMSLATTMLLGSTLTAHAATPQYYQRKNVIGNSAIIFRNIQRLNIFKSIFADNVLLCSLN